jgi:hypothetical protein
MADLMALARDAIIAGRLGDRGQGDNPAYGGEAVLIRHRRQRQLLVGLFPETPYREPSPKIASLRNFPRWHYDRLVPWERYMPVDSDMHDLDPIAT